MHKIPGPGLPESVYEKCFIKEPSLKGIHYKCRLWLPRRIKGFEPGAELRPAVLIEAAICAELKAQEGLVPIYEAVLLSSMQMSEKLCFRVLCLSAPGSAPAHLSLSRHDI